MHSLDGVVLVGHGLLQCSNQVESETKPPSGYGDGIFEPAEIAMKSRRGMRHPGRNRSCPALVSLPFLCIARIDRV